MNSICSFMSINKLVQYIKQTFKGNYVSAILYFDNDEAFKNQFERTCIRPLLLCLKGKNKTKNLYLTQKQLIEKLDNKILVVSFSENNLRQLPKEKGLMCELCIDLDPKTYKDITFYETNILICTNQKNIEMLKKNAVPIISNDDEELPSLNVD